jgi:dihydrofolate reductase
VHLYAAASVDGFLADEQGGVEWLDPYADALEGFGAFIKTIGSTVMGRVTYDDAVKREQADFERPTYVVTHRPFDPPPGVVPWSGGLRELIERIRREHPRDIWLMGGGILVKGFLEQDLIDIWSLAFVPTLLGSGLRLFPDASFAERRLQLVDTQTYPSGVVSMRYERKGPPQ